MGGEKAKEGRRGRLDSKTITTIPKKKKKVFSSSLAPSLFLAYRLRNPGPGGTAAPARTERNSERVPKRRAKCVSPLWAVVGSDHHRLRLCLFHSAQPKPQPFIFLFFCLLLFLSPPPRPASPAPASLPRAPGPAYCSRSPFSGGSRPALPPARRRHWSLPRRQSSAPAPGPARPLRSGSAAAPRRPSRRAWWQPAGSAVLPLRAPVRLGATAPHPAG